jgi:hypothetical protein
MVYIETVSQRSMKMQFGGRGGSRKSVIKGQRGTITIKRPTNKKNILMHVVLFLPLVFLLLLSRACFYIFYIFPYRGHSVLNRFSLWSPSSSSTSL